MDQYTEDSTIIAWSDTDVVLLTPVLKERIISTEIYIYINNVFPIENEFS